MEGKNDLYNGQIMLFSTELFFHFVVMAIHLYLMFNYTSVTVVFLPTGGEQQVVIVEVSLQKSSCRKMKAR